MNGFVGRYFISASGEVFSANLSFENPSWLLKLLLLKLLKPVFQLPADLLVEFIWFEKSAEQA